MRRPRPAGTLYSLGHFRPPGFAPREVLLYDPPGDPAQVRPALLVFDGDRALGDTPAGPGWELHRAVDGLDERRRVRPRLLLVPNGGPGRCDELCAWPVPGWPSPGGRAWAFLDWVAGELVPALHRARPTPPGALGLAACGASWGGAAALLAHYRHPDLFGGALCLSPALWVGDFALFRDLERRPTPTISRIYLDCGALEAEGRMLAAARGMAAVLAARGYQPRQLRFVADPHGEHTELAWRRRLHRALRFFYRR